MANIVAEMFREEYAALAQAVYDPEDSVSVEGKVTR
jgi:hypothetical protein